MRRYIVTRRAPGTLEAAGFHTPEAALGWASVGYEAGMRVTFKSIWVRVG